MAHRVHDAQGAWHTGYTGCMAGCAQAGEGDAGRSPSARVVRTEAGHTHTHMWDVRAGGDSAG